MLSSYLPLLISPPSALNHSHSPSENSIVVSIPFTRVQKEKTTYDGIEMTYDNAEMTHDKIKKTYDKQQGEENRILEFCTTPRTILEIMEELGLKERKSARRHIKPLVEQGRLAMTLPDKPKSKNQKYIAIKYQIPNAYPENQTG